MTEKIYILLPVHNRREITRHFVECLSQQTYSNYHLVLIDDGSTDGTAEMVEEFIDNSTVIQGDGNWWWAGSLQQGINWLNSNVCVDRDDMVLIINDDVTFEQYFLERGWEILKSKANVLLLAQLWSNTKCCAIETGVNAKFESMIFETATSPEKINCLSTRGLLLRLSDINIIGGFRPFLLSHYWSDYEFTIRARRKGFHLMTSSKFFITFDGETTGIRKIANEKHEILESIFSRKSILNPIYSNVFIMLACPKVLIPINTFRIWIRTVRLILKALIFNSVLL
jgi:GT2 family glycosyltransferase